MCKPHTRIAVIGAGVAGVNAARALAQIPGVEFTVFDKIESIGGLWCEGYLGFGIQTPKHMYHFPDEPWPEGTPEFPSGKQVQSYINGYVDKHDLAKHFQLGTRIDNVTRNSDDTWTLTFSKPEGAPAEKFDGIIVCTGLYGAPKIPNFPGQDKFQGEILHSSQFLEPAIVKGKRVVTIGVGKSGIDVANNSMINGAESSDIVFRKAHWFVPQKILGLVPFDWATFNRFGGTLLHPYKKQAPVAKFFHNIFRPAKWAIWRLVEVIFSLQQGLGKLGMKPDVALEIDAFGSGQLETQPSFFKAAREGKIGIHAGVRLKEFKEKSVVLDNGEELPADTVFLATGYNPLDMTKIFAKENIQPEEDGYYLYRGIVIPELPNVYFIGSLSDTFSNITNGAIQSRWVAELLKGKHSLPDVDAMNADIEATKKWKRSWMPDGPSRGSHIQLHQVHYYDELIQDFKGKYKRKGNPIAEIFGPYHPADYKSLVE